MQSTQVRKDLHVYRTMDRKNPKVREDLNIPPCGFRAIN